MQHYTQSVRSCGMKFLNLGYHALARLVDGAEGITHFGWPSVCVCVGGILWLACRGHLVVL